MGSDFIGGGLFGGIGFPLRFGPRGGTEVDGDV